MVCPPADRDDFLASRQVDTLNDDGDSEDLGLERQRKVVLDHRVQAHHLLGLVVAVDDRLFDQPIEPCFAESRRGAPTLPLDRHPSPRV